MTIRSWKESTTDQCFTAFVWDPNLFPGGWRGVSVQSWQPDRAGGDW